MVDSHVHVFTTDMPLVDKPRHAQPTVLREKIRSRRWNRHGVSMAV